MKNLEEVAAWLAKEHPGTRLTLRMSHGDFGYETNNMDWHQRLLDRLIPTTETPLLVFVCSDYIVVCDCCSSNQTAYYAHALVQMSWDDTILSAKELVVLRWKCERWKKHIFPVEELIYVREFTTLMRKIADAVPLLADECSSLSELTAKMTQTNIENTVYPLVTYTLTFNDCSLVYV